MFISPNGRVALRELMEQAWQQVEGQAREMLKRAVEGLLVAERDRRVSEAKQRGEKVYRWGYTVRKCWTTLWGNWEQVRVPRLRGREEIGLLERYERHSLDQMLFALTVGGLSQRKVVGWVRRFFGRDVVAGHDRSGAGASATASRAAAQCSDSREALSGYRGGRNLPALSAQRYPSGPPRRAAGGSGRARRRRIRGL